MSDLSKANALLHKTHSKILLVLRYQGSTCVDRNIIKSLSKITHQIWCNHPLRPQKETRPQKEQWEWRLETMENLKMEG